MRRWVVVVAIVLVAAVVAFFAVYLLESHA
jgi:hypothetical protein